MKSYLYYVDFVLAPVSAFVLIAIERARGPLGFHFWHMFALGYVLWSFLEYVIHRAAHVIKALKDDHWFHHRFPEAASGPTSVASVLIYSSLYVLTLYGFDESVANSLMSGMLMGYTIYLYVHNAIHRHEIPPGHWLSSLKRFHLSHHESGKEENFGVTTKVWDWVFGSKEKK